MVSFCLSPFKQQLLCPMWNHFIKYCWNVIYERRFSQVTSPIPAGSVSSADTSDPVPEEIIHISLIINYLRRCDPPVCLPAQRPAVAVMRSALVEGDKSIRTSEFGRPPSVRPTTKAVVACNAFASRSGIIIALDIASTRRPPSPAGFRRVLLDLLAIRPGRVGCPVLPLGDVIRSRGP